MKNNPKITAALRKRNELFNKAIKLDEVKNTLWEKGDEFYVRGKKAEGDKCFDEGGKLAIRSRKLYAKGVTSLIRLIKKEVLAEGKIFNESTIDYFGDGSISVHGLKYSGK